MHHQALSKLKILELSDFEDIYLLTTVEYAYTESNRHFVVCTDQIKMPNVTFVSISRRVYNVFQMTFDLHTKTVGFVARQKLRQIC